MAKRRRNHAAEAKVESGSDEMKEWSGRIEMAKRFLDKHGDTDKRWSKYVKAMAGDFDSRSELGDEAIDVNLIHSTITTQLSPMWVNEPHVSIKPKVAEINGRDNVRAGEYCELEINYWLRELEVRKSVRSCTLDGQATNHMYLYVGYVKDKAEVEIEGERVEPDPTIRFKQPFVKRLSPRNVLTPPGYCELEEHPWIALHFMKPIEDVKARYGEKAAEIKPSAALYAGDDEISANLREYSESDDCQLCDIYQIWDKRKKRVYTWNECCDKEFLDDGAWPYDLEGFPLVHERVTDIPDEYHGTPPLQYIYPQQKELNAARTSQRKRFNRSKGVVVTGGEVRQEFKDEYASAKDGTILNSGLPSDQPLSNSIMPIPPPAPDPNVLVYEDRIKADLREISGLGAEQRGAGDPNIDSATASANVEKWARVRASDLGDRVRALYIGVARKLWMLLKQFPNEERSRLIAGTLSGTYQNVRYTLADIEGEFDFEMNLTSVLEDNPQNRVVEAISNYNLLRADPLVNPEKLVLDIFTAQNKPDLQSYLQYLRSPDQEFQMMQASLPVEAHERDDHEAHLQAHDVQAASLESALQQIDPMSPMGMQARLMMLLLQAHINDHARQIQRITGMARPGQRPQQMNNLRAGVKQLQGAETQAELAGQRMNAPPPTGIQ